MFLSLVVVAFNQPAILGFTPDLCPQPPAYVALDRAQYNTIATIQLRECSDQQGVFSAMGKSRSATCVIAFLMQKYQISPLEALEQIRQSRPIVEPNEGFMQQLEMYHKMQTPINVEESPVYQRWLYQREIQMSSDCGQAPDADKIRFEDEHVNQSGDADLADLELKCKKCR
jgi:hypothetical protein